MRRTPENLSVHAEIPCYPGLRGRDRSCADLTSDHITSGPNESPPSERKHLARFLQAPSPRENTTLNSTKRNFPPKGVHTFIKVNTHPGLFQVYGLPELGPWWPSRLQPQHTFISWVFVLPAPVLYTVTWPWVYRRTAIQEQRCVVDHNCRLAKHRRKGEAGIGLAFVRRTIEEFALSRIGTGTIFPLFSLIVCSLRQVTFVAYPLSS